MTSLLTFSPQDRDKAGSPPRPPGSSSIPRAAVRQTPQDHWEGLREADVKRDGLFELLKSADARLSPLLSVLTPAAGSPLPEFRPMPPAPGIVPPLSQQVAEFLERRRRVGGTQGIG